jgi:hypothetical protein
MLEFSRQRIKEYTPHDKFAMDASTDDGTYYIIECVFKFCWLYHSNIEEIIKSTTNNI